MRLKLTKFSLFKFLIKNMKSEMFFQTSIFKIIFFMGKGFDIESISNYSLNLKNYRNFLPDSIRYKITYNSNNGYWPIFHDKLIFYHYIKSQLPTPEVYGTIFEGKIFSGDLDFTHNDILTVLKENKRLVLKPLQGGEGRGIFFLSFSENGLYLQNNPVGEKDLKAKLRKLSGYGIFKFYNQHESLAEIYPDSINTIRLLTLYDFEREKPFIFAAVLRLGWSGSKPFDNFNQGGLSSLIDLESGTLSSWKRRNASGNLITGSVHPDTGVKIEGATIPHWEEIKSNILRYLESDPIFNFVGWDILVTQTDFTIIEANHNPGTVSIQIHKPLLEDPRAALFFKKLNIYEG